MSVKKENVNINGSEVIVKIDKGEDIQDYIEIIGRVIEETNASVREYTKKVK